MHDDASSSPRDKLRILELKRSSADRIGITFSNGDEIDVDKNVIIEFDLHSEKVLSPEHINQITHKSEILTIKKAALTIISRQRIARRALGLKLGKKGFQRNSIEEVLDDLASSHFLNDEEYARDWIASRILRHPEGKRNLYLGLLNKGIDKRIATAAIEAVTHEEECEMASGVLENTRKNIRRREDAYRLLSARGFSASVIRETLRNIRFP